jgi:hypothetical protein
MCLQVHVPNLLSLLQAEQICGHQPLQAAVALRLYEPQDGLLTLQPLLAINPCNVLK